jgi:hypothetical protein
MDTHTHTHTHTHTLHLDNRQVLLSILRESLYDHAEKGH